MLSALILTAALAAGDTGTLWRWAYELGQPVPVTAAGEYSVWAWSTADAAPTVALDSEALKFPGNRRSGDWWQSEFVDLGAGTPRMSADEDVVAVVLTPLDTWRPEIVAPLVSVVQAWNDVPRDNRVRKRKGTNTVFKMTEFESREDWESFADRLRRKILISSGLWPMPEKTPLNAKVFGRIEHEDYIVEKVHFEAAPGFLVTGNLYRPVKPAERVPGVACPHGHWEHGRLEDGERGSVPARGITLARMGMVAFTYDMAGYNDSLQLGHKWESEAEKLWGIHPFGLQLLSSIRVLDFLETLPEVDPERLACTGASGGGTQTFALAAVDPRVKVAAPVNMISSTMQGGCVCENAPLIRLNNSNMEIGALMAPRPMLMVSATGDWTKLTPKVEYPAVRSIYALYGAEDQLEEVQIDAPHNYNLQSREAVYRFLGKHLLGGEGWEDYTEPAYELDPVADMRVFPEDALPEGYKKEGDLIAALIDQRRARVKRALASRMSEDEQASWRDALGDALMLEAPLDADAVRAALAGETRDENFVCQSWIIGRKGHEESIPLLLFTPADTTPVSTIDLMVSDRGKTTFLDLNTGGLHPALRTELAMGHAVALIEPFWTGEHRAWHQDRERTATDEGFYDTFEAADTARRVQDLLTGVAFLSDRLPTEARLVLTADGDASVWAMLAAPFDSRIAKVNADLPPDAIGDEAIWIRNYVPAILTLGGLERALSLFGGAQS